MDSTTRLIAKSVTWQVAGFFSMMFIGFLFTSSFTAGSGIALAGAASGFLSYFLHEMVWSKINWGRKAALSPTRKDS